MKVLLTGASGFVGQKLKIKLIAEQYDVYAFNRNFSSADDPNFLDVTDKKSMAEVIKKIQPDCVVHLAAQSNVSTSWKEPIKTLETNILGTINLVEAVYHHAPRSKILSIGSAEEYGSTAKQGIPLSEEMACFPQNPYAVSKFSAGQVAIQLAQKYGLALIHTRSFNHFGPGQSLGFVVSDFASQIASIEKELQPPIIQVGDIEVYRDFTYIDDIISAYTQLIQGESLTGVYNVCSGKAVKILDVLNELLSFSSKGSVIKVEQDDKRFRKSDVPFFMGSSDKLRKNTTWQPGTTLTAGLKATLEWWRKHVEKESI